MVLLNSLKSLTFLKRLMRLCIVLGRRLIRGIETGCFLGPSLVVSFFIFVLFRFLFCLEFPFNVVLMEV